MDSRDNKLSLSIVDATAEENIADVAAELAEVALDSVLDASEIIEAVPFLGSVLKLAKVGISIRDRLFLKKLAGFLFELDKVSPTERAKYILKLSDDPDFKEKIGVNLLILLEKLDDIDKPTLIGKLFCFYIKGEIDYLLFARLAVTIDKLYLPDLSRLFEFTDKVDLRSDDANLSLANVGLLYMPSDTVGVCYAISKTGLRLIELLNKSS